MKILIASYLEPQFVAQIRQTAPQFEVIYRPDLIGVPRYVADHTAMPERTPAQESAWRALLAQADILFDFDYSHREDLPELAPKLKWIQATSAGIGQYVKRMRYDTRTDWIFTTASGVHSRPLAEFALMAMLLFAKDFEYLQREKAARHWARYSAHELADFTVGILGLGKIGREVARLAKAFDMRVVGNRRNPSKETLSYVDAVYGPDELPLLLAASNFFVLATPHTDETERLIGREELAQLPPGAVLINIARGKIVDEAALIAALQSGHLRGAALDVFETEPLPSDSPLWALPNVIISPHSASTASTENQKLTDLFCENLKRYIAGESLINQLDTTLLY
ncbi:MAG: D-2-hydroxyacid dehydrogenase [Chloroflexi bacterium]|nr:MAG: D-2-hydroxyacid dehydrogenase [Chloroflexota bacterium]